MAKSTRLRDIVVKVGEYEDRNTGERKSRWKSVGTLMKMEEDGSMFIILERTFNPAGVPNPDNRETVLLSCFVPQDQRDGSARGSDSRGSESHQGGSASGGQMDDNIPF